MSLSQISWFCSSCLLFGDPLTPHTAVVIYGRHLTQRHKVHNQSTREKWARIAQQMLVASPFQKQTSDRHDKRFADRGRWQIVRFEMTVGEAVIFSSKSVSVCHSKITINPCRRRRRKTLARPEQIVRLVQRCPRQKARQQFSQPWNPDGKMQFLNSPQNISKTTLAEYAYPCFSTVNHLMAARLEKIWNRQRTV